MYTEAHSVFPPNYYQSFSIHNQWNSHTTTDSMASAILEYDLGVEGDLFKALEPVIEEQVVGLDSMTEAAISMISGGEDVISSTQGLEVGDIELLQNEQLLSEVFCEFKDLLANEAQLSEVMQMQIPVAVDESGITKEKVVLQGSLPRSISSECLSSVEWIHHGNPMNPNFLGFSGLDFGAVYGMRRAFSEGDIKTIGTQSPDGQAQCSGHFTSEDRREKLFRYRTKKTKRNFGRKIKYACRKALADSQPRVRGRFAKTDESDIAKCNNI